MTVDISKNVILFYAFYFRIAQFTTKTTKLSPFCHLSKLTQYNIHWDKKNVKKNPFRGNKS